MSNLAKQDGYRAKVAMAIVAMSSVLSTYGKRDDDAMLAGWFAGLRSRQFPESLIEPTTEWFCGNAEAMPCPKTFMEKGWDLKARLEVEDRLAATVAEAKAEDEARILELREKYPEIDGAYVKALFERTTKSLTDGKK